MLRRPNIKNPYLSSCSVALKRICGVCVHHGADTLAPVSGTCGMFGHETSTRAAAGDCDAWARKSAPADSAPAPLPPLSSHERPL
jgi:hypothetical protein